MNQGLSKREKILLYLCVIILLILISTRFVISPLNNIYSQKQEELNYLRMEKDSIELKILNEPSTIIANDKANLDLEDIRNRYPQEMPNEEVDKLLTGICLENRLYPTMLGISDIRRTQFSGETEDVALLANAPHFAVITVAMNVNGDYESLKSLINHVERIEYIRISGLTYAKNQSQQGTEEKFSLKFEVTLLNDTGL